MLIAVPKETIQAETRVALTPQHTKKLCSMGININVEKNAGFKAGYFDEEYIQAGATICNTPLKTYKNADLIFKIWAPQKQDFLYLSKNQTILCNTQNIKNKIQLNDFVNAKINLFALNQIPRTSIAQNMDILSSQDSLAGYRAILTGLYLSKKNSLLLITAAGTLEAMKVLIIGLGISGLQAAAIAHRMGCIVYAFDKKTETEEQATSVGAIFIKNITDEILSSINIIITNAQITGKPAPKVLTKKQLSTLSHNCILIDMAYDNGGNINPEDLPQNITLIQNSHFAQQIPYSASKLYSENIFNFCQLLIKDNTLKPDFNNEIIAKTTLCWQGKINFTTRSSI